MSRTIPIALQAHFESRRLTLAVLCKATREDGVTFGFTDVDIDIPFGGQLYRAASLGFTMSASEATDEYAADNHEVRGTIGGGGITRLDVLAGLWDYAELEFSIVNYLDLAAGAMSEARGNIGAVTLGELGFTVEFLDIKQRLAKTLLRVVTNVCDTILGDERCKVDLAPFTRTATAGPGPTDRTFNDPTCTEADGWWSGGNLVCMSSSNPAAVGLKMQIKRFHAGGDFELILPLFYGIAEGDTFTITPGCNHMKRMEDGTFTGDCVVKYDNAINFRGFDDVPGTDAATSYQPD